MNVKCKPYAEYINDMDRMILCNQLQYTARKNYCNYYCRFQKTEVTNLFAE
jgi:hypothetical protein